MAQAESRFGHAGGLERGQQQFLDFQVRLDAGMAEQFGADLERLPAAPHAGRLGAQHRAGIAQPGRALMVDEVGVDAGGLGRHVGAHAQHAAGQAVHHLEGFQVQVPGRPGEQGFQVFHQGRADQVVAVGVEQIEQAPPQALRRPGIMGQDIFDVFGEEPGGGH
jgi:hypothetical protein